MIEVEVTVPEVRQVLVQHNQSEMHDDYDPTRCRCRRAVSRAPNMTGSFCADCGSMMVRTGSCETCTGCGSTGGCG